MCGLVSENNLDLNIWNFERFMWGGRHRRHRAGKVFDLTLALDEVAEGYLAMDQRRAVKTFLQI